MGMRYQDGDLQQKMSVGLVISLMGEINVTKSRMPPDQKSMNCRNSRL